MFFRYRETNDNLVAAFIYLVRKLTESAKGYAKQRIVEDVTIVRTKLKSAGSLLKYFIDTDMDDDLSFGDVRKKAFELIPADSIKLLSDHLDNNDFDGRQYEWQFIDKQSSKIKKLIRSLFMSICSDLTSYPVWTDFIRTSWPTIIDFTLWGWLTLIKNGTTLIDTGTDFIRLGPL